ncbi:MAG: flagellar basal-body rod protein FlgF [Thiohalospira sp.]
MDRMLYIGMTGAKHASRSLESTNNNLSNASTPGFREDFAQFRSMPVFGPGHDSRAYAQVERPGINHDSGPLETTGRNLDVAIQGEGFFAVQDEQGETAYTRRGDLRVTANGILENGAGEPVLGENGPVAVPPNSTLDIGADGTITVQAEGSPANAVAVVDRLQLVNPPAEELEKGEDGLLRRADGEEAAADGGVSVVSGSLEGSNVSPTESLVQMIELQRRHEMQVKVMKAADDNAQSTAQVMRLQ